MRRHSTSRTRSIASAALSFAFLLALSTTSVHAQEDPPNSGGTGTPGQQPHLPPANPVQTKPDGLVKPIERTNETEPNPKPLPTPTPTPNPTPTPAPAPAPAPAPSPTPAAAPSATPVRPATATTQRPTTAFAPRRRNSGTTSFKHWETWWRYNRDLFVIRKKYRLNERSAVSKNSGVFIGNRVTNRKSATKKPEFNDVRQKIVPVLERAITDSHPSVRAEACIALGRIGEPRHAASLMAALRDTTKTVREAAALGLGLLGAPECVPPLIAIVKADATGQRLRGGRRPEDQLRAVASLALGLTGRDRSGESSRVLTRVSGHRSATLDMSIAATIGLGSLTTSGAVDRHLKALAGKKRISELIRAHAVTSIGRVNKASGRASDKRTLDGIAYLMNEDRSTHVRRSAISAFADLLGVTADGRKRDDRVLETASKLLRRTREKAADNQSRNLAAVTLGALGGDAAYRALCAAVRRNPRAANRAYSALGLGILIRNGRIRLGQAGADATRNERFHYGLKCLRDAFKQEKSRSIKGAFAIALGLARDHDYGPEMHRALKKEKNPTLRSYLALGLGMVGYEEAATDLKALVSKAEDSIPIRERVALGLGILGPQQLLPVFEQFASRSAYTLQALLRAMGLAGDHRAVKPLTSIVSNQRRPIAVRAAACRALGVLGDPKPVPTLAALRRNHNYLATSLALNALLLRD